MLQKTPFWAFLCELCFPDLCMDKTCLCSVLQQSGENNSAGLSPAVSSLLVIPLCYTSSSFEILLLCQTQTPCCGAGIGACCTFETVAVAS